MVEQICTTAILRITSNEDPDTKSSKNTARRLAKGIMKGKPDKAAIWAATAIPLRSGGIEEKYRRIILGALRKKGFCFYIALYEHESKKISSECGIVPRNQIPIIMENTQPTELQFGNTAAEAACKLGNGDTAKGWERFNNCQN